MFSTQRRFSSIRNEEDVDEKTGTFLKLRMLNSEGTQT
jgi:hypothetical protein